MKITEKDFLRAMPQETNQRYFDMVNRRIARTRSEAAARKGRHLMKKIGKFAIGAVVTAAVLTAGGITAMVAMRGSRGGYNKYDGSSIKVTETHEEKIELQLLPDDGKAPDMYLAQGATYNGWALPFAETDDGWYFARTQETLLYDTGSDSGGASSTQTDSAYFCFKSKATGEVVPLCDRANCLHDGNEYCEASTKQYDGGSLFVLDGKLCRLGSRMDAAGTRQGTYLLTYAPNGTGIEETAELDPYLNPNMFCVFRGDLFYITYEYKEYSNADTGVSYQQSGWSLCCYEPSTGKNYKLYEHVPTGEKTAHFTPPSQMFGIGDDMFIYSTNNHNGYTGDGIFRINLLTLESEQIDETAVINSVRVMATRDAIVYVDSSGFNAVGKRYDIAKHELTEGLTELRKSLNDAGKELPYVLSDSGYTVWLKTDWNRETLKTERNIFIGDDKGNLLAQADISPFGTVDLAIIRDGWLYVSTDTQRSFIQTVFDEKGNVIDTVLNTDGDLNCYLLRVKLSDFAGGKTDPNEWEKVLTLTEKTAKEAYLDWAHEEQN